MELKWFLKYFMCFFAYFFVQRILRTIIDLDKFMGVSAASYADYYGANIYLLTAYNIMLIVPVLIIPFMIFKIVKCPCFKTSLKAVVKKYWVMYVFLIVFIIEIGCNSLSGLGELYGIFEQFYLHFNYSTTSMYVVGTIQEMLCSEVALVFFCFVPFGCHIAAKERIWRKECL